MRHVTDEHVKILESHYGPENLWLPDHGQRNIKYGSYRDAQRQKLYDSESDLTWKMRNRERQFKTLDEMRKYVEVLIATDWWQERFPYLQKVAIENTQALHAWAQCYQNKMGFPVRLAWHMTERILLHELAHLLVKDPHPHHGPLYARVYRDLVQFQMGDEWADEMTKQFTRHKVRYTPYPKKAANQNCPVYATDKGHRVKVSRKLYEYVCEAANEDDATLKHRIQNPANQNRAFATIEVESVHELETLEKLINHTRWAYLPSAAVQVSAAAGRLCEAIDHYVETHKKEIPEMEEVA